MAFFSQDKFSLGVVSEEASIKRDVLGSGAALKKATNVFLTKGGSITKVPGCFIVDKIEKEALKVFSFSFNKYNSYFCVIVHENDSNLTKLIIWDQKKIIQEIRLPYSAEDVKNLTYQQINDIMFFYCDGYQIQILKRTEDLSFSFDSFDIKPFINMKRNSVGLFPYYNANEDRWEIKAEKAYFENTFIGKTLYLQQNINAYSNEMNTTDEEAETPVVFAREFAFSITAEQNTEFKLLISEDGENYNAVYANNITQGATATYTYEDSGKEYFFKVKVNRLSVTGDNLKTTINYARKAFKYIHEIDILEIINDRFVIGRHRNDSQKFNNLFISEQTSEETEDLILPDSVFDESYDVNLLGEDGTNLNKNIFGKEETDTNIRTRFKERFKFYKDTPNDKVSLKYEINLQTPVLLERLRIKGNALYYGKTERAFLLYEFKSKVKVEIENNINEKIQIYDDIKEISYSWSSSSQIHHEAKQNRNIDITIEGKYYRVSKITITYQLDSYQVASGYKENESGFPLHIDLYAFRAQGRKYTSATEDILSRYLYYYGYQEHETYCCGCLFQNRHLIATKSKIIVSTIAGYDNFDNLKNNRTEDDSPFIVTQNTKKLGEIVALLTFQNKVLCLTGDNEFLLTFGDGAGFTAANHKTNIIGESGSERIMPLITEEGFVSVERGGRLYFQGYGYFRESYNRNYLDIYADFKNKKIKQIERGDTSDCIYILFGDGTLVRMFLKIENEHLSVGFFPMEIDGKVKGITVVDKDDNKEMWAVVDNKIVKFERFDGERLCYLHFALTYSDIESFRVPEYFDTQEKEVYIQCFDAKGTWIERVKEKPGDIHKLKKHADTAYFGQYYCSEIETLELGGEDDTFPAKKKKVTKILPYFVDTAGVEINGEKIKGDDLNKEYINFLSGKINAETQNGLTVYSTKYTTSPTLKIKSYAPLPWTLARLSLSITGE